MISVVFSFDFNPELKEIGEGKLWTSIESSLRGGLRNEQVLEEGKVLTLAQKVRSPQLNRSVAGLVNRKQEKKKAGRISLIVAIGLKRGETGILLI
jgi:hypothetical protein